eukprot:gnl/TRDRNA2_/TRDRNA2_63491_c1_seq1.p1 gnl/TRDRNA2_/TRDRNA2_63491_c1~~gnl/TRDRNA2_/TRDRNA2_63491_c1_seq1.p1  ORF type:complete len:206 (+),score=31.36 gnl/TRDRNA2_/TRDRNA2_63491_c1_seq1:2-619(+)
MVEDSGADVEWRSQGAQVNLRGSATQIFNAERLLARVVMHCNWGASEGKITRLLRPPLANSVLCRLSPMNTLKPTKKLLNEFNDTLTIGKDSQNDVVIKDPVVSRNHCILELDQERGAVYVIDCSTNGTFLNGTRLPAKNAGKVLLSHGDDLIFKDPSSGGDSEFGYIVNLTDVALRPEVKLEPPKRLLSQEELAYCGGSRDFEA